MDFRNDAFKYTQGLMLLYQVDVVYWNLAVAFQYTVEISAKGTEGN